MSNSRAGPSSAVAGSSAASSSAMDTVHQVGARQAHRSRTRTRQGAHPGLPHQHVSHRSMRQGGASSGPAPSTRRYTSEDHPMSPHNLAARGYHTFQCLGVPFHVSKRYTYVRELGIGAYGCVALAKDEILGCKVAIKKVTRVFEREVLTRRALREVAILRHLGSCHNITGLLDFDTTFVEFNEIYLVLEASEADLSQIIRSGQALSDAHLQYFVAQILRAVRYMHAANVIHRDLKPANMLVNADCHLKLCDFGLARAHAPPVVVDERHNGASESRAPASTPMSSASSSSAGENGEVEASVDRPSPLDHATMGQQPPADEGRIGSATSSSSSKQTHQQMTERTTSVRSTRLRFPGGPLTEYVATRWYRAPEIMLCYKQGYGPEMDMWSVGCILAELMGGKPIFAGKDYVDQLARINGILGPPSDATVAKIGSERAKVYVQSLPRMPAVPLANLYPKASPLAVDLLSKLLTWDPSQRISADEALRHPWLEAYHKSNAAWTAPPAFSRFNEVEMVQSLQGFLQSFKREADEIHAELAELDAEEAEEEGRVVRAEHEAGASQGGESSNDSEHDADTAERDADENAALPNACDARDDQMRSPSQGAVNDGQSGLEAPNASERISRSGSVLPTRGRRPRAHSSSSRGISPIASPSSLVMSDGAGSPTYETDPTSASAPQSVAGSTSAAVPLTDGKRDRSCPAIRRGGQDLAPEEGAATGSKSSSNMANTLSSDGALASGALDLKALDRSLAEHGRRQEAVAAAAATVRSGADAGCEGDDELVSADEEGVEKHVEAPAPMVAGRRRTFRRRAVTNAASLGPLTLGRRSKSCPDSLAYGGSRRASVAAQGLVISATAAAVAVGTRVAADAASSVSDDDGLSAKHATMLGARRTDIIRRPISQREGLAAIDVGGDFDAVLSAMRNLRHGAPIAVDGCRPENVSLHQRAVALAKHDSVVARGEGSDASTVGKRGGSTAGTSCSSPTAVA